MSGRLATAPAVGRRLRAPIGAALLALALGLAGMSAAAAEAPTGAAKGSKTPAASRRAAAPDSAEVLALLAGTLNASCPLRGVATGGQITSEHVSGLRRAGFRTVLDLRAPGEPRGFDEAAVIRKAGLDYRTLPVTAASLNDSSFDAVRALLEDGRRHPILVHCASGNRVGVVMLPWLVLDRGWALDAAITAAARGGMRDGPMKDQAIAYVERHRAAR